MADRFPAPRPVSASIILLRSHGYAHRPVADQTRIKGQLEALVAIAVAPLPPGRWLVLDAPEGLAVVVLSGGESALDTAQRALAAAADLRLAIGVNHGPVVAEAGDRGEIVLAGDGIETAMVVAGFAMPGSLLVSRTLRDEIAEQAPERAEDLRPAGTFSDARVRTHDLYAPDEHAARRRRQRLFLLGAIGFSGIIALGFAARAARQRRMLGGARATIEFEITPRGDVLIDGESKGRSPPLTSIDIAPGIHVIEVRNAQNPPLRLKVNLQRGESMTIRHSFPVPEAGTSGPIRDLKRKLGL